MGSRKRLALDPVSLEDGAKRGRLLLPEVTVEDKVNFLLGKVEAINNYVEASIPVINQLQEENSVLSTRINRIEADISKDYLCIFNVLLPIHADRSESDSILFTFIKNMLKHVIVPDLVAVIFSNMGVKHFLAALILAVTIYNVYSAVAIFQAELGKEVKLDFGKGMFLIKRRTKAFDEPQYLFASPKQDGSWTTDGKTKIPSTAHLFWNGTLIFKKFTKDDVGSYEMPLEAAKIKTSQGGGISAVGNTMYQIVLKE